MEIKETLELIKKEVFSDVETIRGDMAEIKDKNSARYTELVAQHDKAMDKIDELHSKFDSMEAAVNRPEVGAEQKQDEMSMEHKEAFDHYLRTAEVGDLRALEQKALSVGSDPDGGYVASEEMSNMVIKTIYETSPVRQAANVMSTNKKEMVFLVDKDEAGAGWVAEQGSIVETSTPQFAELRMAVHKMYAEPAATNEILADADINMEAWLGSKVGERFARESNLTFVSGNGIGKPRGFTTYPAGTAWEQIEQITTAASVTIDELDLVELIGAVKSPYLTGASFGMSRTTNKVLRKLQDTNGAFVFSGQDLVNRQLWGYQIHQYDDMVGPATASTYVAGDLPIVFGNMKTAYTILDRQGVSVLRDPFTSKGLVKFYTTMRVGGGVTNFESIKLLNIKA